METGTVVQGNYIGVNPAKPTVSKPGNLVGVSITSANNTIGGTANGLGNIIGNSSLSGGAGISISGPSAFGNIVQGDFVGTDLKQNNLGNNVGVLVGGGAYANLIGGATANNETNIIGFNATGISITGLISGGAGQSRPGKLYWDRCQRRSMPNNTAGIAIEGSSFNTIGPGSTVITGKTIGSTLHERGNVIAANLHDGVTIESDAEKNLVVGDTMALQ